MLWRWSWSPRTKGPRVRSKALPRQKVRQQAHRGRAHSCRHFTNSGAGSPGRTIRGILPLCFPRWVAEFCKAHTQAAWGFPNAGGFPLGKRHENTAASWITFRDDAIPKPTAACSLLVIDRNGVGSAWVELAPPIPDVLPVRLSMEQYLVVRVLDISGLAVPKAGIYLEALDSAQDPQSGTILFGATTDSFGRVLLGLPPLWKICVKRTKGCNFPPISHPRLWAVSNSVRSFGGKTRGRVGLAWVWVGGNSDGVGPFRRSAQGSRPTEGLHGFGPYGSTSIGGNAARRKHATQRQVGCPYPLCARAPGARTVWCTPFPQEGRGTRARWSTFKAPRSKGKR